MTDRVIKVLAIAEQEARRRGATEVEPQHVLLALALEGAGVAARVLQYLGATVERLSQELPVSVSAPAGSTEPLPWAPGTEELVAQAHAELVPLGHTYVGTEHLVLAVAQSTSGSAPELLSRLGITGESLRREVYEILGHGL